ncbi:unnamed protein product [Urochloa humidicola]
MTTPNIPSMNAMVDSITDAVETAIIRGNHSGGVRRFMVQGAVRRALRDIHSNRIPTRRSTGHRERRSHALQAAPSPVLLVRRTATAPPPPPLSSLPLATSTGTMPPPPAALMTPTPTLVTPMPLTTLRNRVGTMAARRGVPPFYNSNDDEEMWPPGFAYDLNITPPSPLLPSPPRSYADVASNRRTVLPSGSTLGAGFVSPTTKHRNVGRQGRIRPG